MYLLLEAKVENEYFQINFIDIFFILEGVNTENYLNIKKCMKQFKSYKQHQVRLSVNNLNLHLSFRFEDFKAIMYLYLGKFPLS